MRVFIKGYERHRVYFPVQRIKTLAAARPAVVAVRGKRPRSQRGPLSCPKRRKWSKAAASQVFVPGEIGEAQRATSGKRTIALGKPLAKSYSTSLPNGLLPDFGKDFSLENWIAAIKTSAFLARHSP
jgi:hypothetical protein